MSKFQPPRTWHDVFFVVARTTFGVVGYNGMIMMTHHRVYLEMLFFLPALPHGIMNLGGTTFPGSRVLFDPD